MNANVFTGATRADAHYLRVKGDLLAGRFEPGTVLLETTLGQLYGVSRTPMREALARLAHDRLIDRTERGYVVRERSAEEIQAIYEARIPLEGSAASLAATRRGTIDVDRLDHLLALRRDEPDHTRHPQLNSDFHVALRDAARSPVITSTLGQLDDMLTDYRPDRTPSPTTRRGLDEHLGIMAAIRDGDSAGARTLMVSHLERMRDMRIAAHVRRTR
ncbi:GntR family transcriptional regulator [Mycobacterium yunnanensis]|uniref:GntR family transcriptional regulator n=1 Tax=Mycobacterium yunnanensis TaxID=368477 RepID=A0A9X2Z919_9MYCO|nr:GntR family transcriptional regulator [Mycobacterium yunnanensis]MCV7424046.1 GntR family transcriptional regulator [Mycobacterium yunnanensis]